MPSRAGYSVCVPKTELLIAAASSLTDALPMVGRAFEASVKNAVMVRFTFGASGALVRQVIAGAPIDAVAFAGDDEMNQLAKAKRIEPATRAGFAANRLVLVAPIGGTVRAWADLTDAKKAGRVALGDPRSVPAGRYARNVLTRRGLWTTLKTSGRLVYASNVRQALAYAAEGNADAALVFATDARAKGAQNRVRIVGAPDTVPAVYPAAVVLGSPHAPEARAFVRFLQTRDSRQILTRYGFEAPPGKNRI